VLTVRINHYTVAREFAANVGVVWPTKYSVELASTGRQYMRRVPGFGIFESIEPNGAAWDIPAMLLGASLAQSSISLGVVLMEFRRIRGKGGLLSWG